MRQVYDIYLNFNKNCYDFYDWNKDDDILHIKKIPIFKLNNKDFIKLLTTNFKLSSNFLNIIKDKTEYINKISNKDICALFTDSINIIAIMFDNNGISIKRSNLFIDEELEVLDEIEELNETNIAISIINKIEPVLKTRKQRTIEKFIYKELQNIDNDKLSYIFFECFGKYENNKDRIINNIKKIDITSDMSKKIYDILKLTSTNKNKMI